MIVSMLRRFLPAFVAPALAACALASSAAAVNFPPGWTEISINVVVHHVPHTLVYDRGTIISVGGGSITLRERDGNVVPIAVASNAQITVDGVLAGFAQLRVGETATTLREDGNPASKVTAQIGPRLAALIARQQGGG